MSEKRRHTIAVIPGDGIGLEVVPEALRVLDAAAAGFGFALDLRHHDFASCDHYLRHGKMLPDDLKDLLTPMDAIFFGARARGPGGAGVRAEGRTVGDRRPGNGRRCER